MGSSAIGQALLVAASPVLTRLYSPAEFAVFGAFAAIAMLLTTIAGLRYEAAIPLPREDREASQLLTLALLFGAVTSLVALAAVLFGRDTAAETLNLPALATWLWLLPATVALGTAYQALSLWHIRKTSFSHIARTNVLQSTSTIATQLSIGAVAGGATGLILGDVVAKAAGVIALGRVAVCDLGGQALAFAGSGLASTAAKYWRFPAIASVSALANLAAIQIPAPLIAALYGANDAGALVLAQRMVALPASLVATAAGQVFVGQAAVNAQRQPAATLAFYRFAVLRLAACAGAFAVVGLAGIPLLFEPVFGARWAEAAGFSQILCLSAAAGLVVAPVSQIVFLAGRQASQLVGDVLRLGLVAGAIVVAHAAWPESATAAVAAYGAVMALSYAAFLGFYYRCAKEVSKWGQ